MFVICPTHSHAGNTSNRQRDRKWMVSAVDSDCLCCSDVSSNKAYVRIVLNFWSQAMAKFIQLSTLPYNHFVESSNKQSLFQAAAAAANAFAYNKKKCLALLFIAVVIALVVSFNQIYHLQPTYIPRQLVAICQEDRFYTGSAATCRRTPMVDDNVDCRLCWWPLQTGNYADLLLKNSSAQKVNWFPATDDSYVRCATDCNHFRHLFGYSMSIENVTEEERIFPLAFRLEKHC